jgi:O-antigen ligase
MWCSTSRHLALVNLVFPLTSGAIWYFWPEAGWWPVLILIVPVGVWLTSVRFSIRRTPFDLLLGVYLLAAAAGVWAAYDRQTAWNQFWLILCGIVLFYVLASQPAQNLPSLTWVFSGFGFIFSLFFWLTQNWGIQPVKFIWLSRVGTWWEAYRPDLGIQGMQPNIAAGILAVLIPIAGVSLLTAWEQKARRRLYLAFFLISFMLITLLFTASRGAWISLAVSLGIIGSWGISKRIPMIVKKWLFQFAPQSVFVVCLLSVFLLGSLAALRFPGELIALANRLPGPASGTTRAALFDQTLDLLQDVPFTGGGLGAFPAFYSVYIRAVPDFYYGYAHNLYLDLWFELGIFGFLAVLGIQFGAILLIHPWKIQSHTSRLSWAVVAALFVLLFHGIVDDALFGSRTAVFLFVPAGLGVAVWHVNKQGMQSSRSPIGGRLRMLLALGLLVICGLAWRFRVPLQAAWYADLGVVSLARLELVGFAEHMPAVLDPNQLQKPVNYLERALVFQPANRTALFHMGRIQTRLLKFSQAITNLQAAAQADPDHRGIQKILGYDYVWVGRFDLAWNELRDIPEAKTEMTTYSWWWGTQQRQDLAQRAVDMAERLAAGTVSP